MHAWPSERVGIAGKVDPQTCANVAKLTDAVDMSKWAEVLFVILLGDMAAETVDFKVTECATSGGSYTDLAGKAITQRAAHASNNDNTVYLVNVKAEELSSGKQYIKGNLVTGNTTGGPASVIALGLRPKYGPASDSNLAAVKEIIY